MTPSLVNQVANVQSDGIIDVRIVLIKNYDKTTKTLKCLLYSKVGIYHAS